jgi:hypothetical protein
MEVHYYMMHLIALHADLAERLLDDSNSVKCPSL